MKCEDNVSLCSFSECYLLLWWLLDRPKNNFVLCMCRTRGTPTKDSVTPLPGLWYNHNLGLFFLRYPVKLGENTLSLPGCHHMCKKEIEERKCCPGFWGTECYECPGGSENPCNGHGTCLDGIQQNGTCVCQEQYSGYGCQNCRDENHFGPDCQSECDCVHGECSSGTAGNGSCTCYGGYTGPRCDQELPLCRGVTCEANSECVVRDGAALCDCKLGYTKQGSTCQAQDPCAPSPCSPFAVCKVLGPRTYECTCKEGFQGDGKICQPINPCVDRNGGCPENSTICVYRRPGEVRAVTAKIGDGRSCYKDLLGEINQQNLRGRFTRKLNVNCGLPAILDGPGPFTVFVPSNDAVDGLRDGRLIYLFTEVRAQSPVRHPELVTVEQLMMMPHIVTMANQILTINISADGRILMDESGIPLKMQGIVASNGIIHTLDGIFIPPSIVPILPHRCNEEQHKIVMGSCVDCEALNNSICPPDSKEMEPTLYPKECVYIHDPQGLNVLKKGCARYCNQTITKPGCCKGFFGPDCLPCPGGFSTPCYGRGNCSDGIQGSGNCHCFEGFKGTACHICANPNKHGENCDEDCGCVHGVCDNRPGSGGVCQSWSCKEGYTGKFCDRTSKNCGPSGLSQYCHQHAVCSLNDTARCICMDGYTGDGFSCQPIDLCSQPERGGCSQNALCTSTGPGTATCQCNVGWTGDGRSCAPIDNCMLESRGSCHLNADCIYTGPGQSKCVCKRGYAGDGHSCDAINPCLMDNGGCHDLATCVPLGGGERSCVCSEGYAGDGMMCYGDILKVSEQQMSEKSLFSIPAGANVTVLVPSEAAIKNLSNADKDFWLTPHTLPFLVRAHFLEGVFTAEKLKKLDGPEVPTLNPQTRWQINTTSGVRDNETVQYHIVLGEKLLPADLRSGVHKESMLGLSYWLMFYQNSTQVREASLLFLLRLPLPKAGDSILPFPFLKVMLVTKEHFTGFLQLCALCVPHGWLTPACSVFQRSVCCPGYYGHQCEMCPGRPGRWCSGHGECQDGSQGSGECRCLEGFHGTACEMCEVGRYGADCRAECACDNGICNDGLQGDGSCECNCEIDPCTIDHGGCSMHAVCTKVSPGERTCACKEGYAGDGTLCMEIDLCLENNGGCHTNAECIKTGPKKVSVGWIVTAELLQAAFCFPCQNNGGCSPFGLCKYTGPGTRNCSCSWHSIGDGFTCRGKVHQVRGTCCSFCAESIKELSGAGPFTVFVPQTDLIGNTTVVSALPCLLRDLLRYHMVGCQKLLSSDLENQESLTSLSGHKIKISVSENSITLNKEAKVVASDIVGVNGVIHFINKILIPSDLVALCAGQGCVPGRAVCRAGALSPRVAVLRQDAELLPLLGDPAHRPFTLLWPTDAAFRALPESRQRFLYRREHRDVLASLLKAHMIRDTKVSDVPESQRHMEFNGGIAYGIDRLLEPPDLGSRCDEFTLVELQVSTWGEVRENLGHPCSPCLGRGIHFSSRGPLRRGCRRSCVSSQWLPQCCANHYGRDCRACPGGLEAPCKNRGTCDDKIGGSGICNCSQEFIGTGCELCAPGRYGPECRECNCTENGVCNGGLHGDGFCFCAEGWTGDRCEIRLVVAPSCSPPCHARAVCRAGNLCECELHYEGDGRACSVIDMCSQDNGGCARHARCSQTGVNVSCSCEPGYSGDGYICEPIDRCADGRNGDCSEHARCISTGPNERRCECKQGYVGDGMQCLEQAVPPTDRCLQNNGQCHREATCTDLHFHGEYKTMGVFHLQSPQRKYDFTYEQAQAACAAEGASLATFQQLGAAQQMGFHLCLVGWLDNGTAGYPTAYPNPSCGSSHVGIVDYGFRSNLSETWDAFCYREKDVTCTCRDGFVGDGYWCSGKLPEVLAEQDRFSTFYSVSDTLLALQEQQGTGRDQMEQGGAGVWSVCKTQRGFFPGLGAPGLGRVMALCCQQCTEGEDLPSLPDVA
uniref:Stabilin 1 n=1 Tax=Ficedula albicollis TaxID=59894 RepID=A0A803V533_FICAL